MKSKKGELSKEIARLTCKYRKLEEIECIYLLPIKDKKRKIYELVMICSSEIEGLERKTKLYNLSNRDESKIEQYGGRLDIVLDTPRNYVPGARTELEIDKTRSLRSSKILFDRTGLYKEIARDESVSKYSNSFRFHIRKKLLLESKQDKQ